jgi:amidase
MTDELCCSMSGINPHYGTPVNSACPDRLCGGSSSGSAAAVGGGVADFALGTDTSGSVRVPAAWCGLYGMRPSQGRVSAMGVVPLAPSFDTVGWMAADLETLRRVGEVLLAEGGSSRSAGGGGGPGRLVFAADLFGYVDREVGEALLPEARRLGGRGVELLDEAGFAAWFRTHAVLVGEEVREAHQAWIDAVRPRFGPDVGQRLRPSDEEDPAERADHEARRREASQARVRIRAHLDALLEGDVVIGLPTAPCLAPPRSASEDELTTAEVRAIALNCAASMGGFPQVTCPWASTPEGVPVGLSFLAARGRDLWLLEQVARYCGRPTPRR